MGRRQRWCLWVIGRTSADCVGPRGADRDRSEIGIKERYGRKWWAAPQLRRRPSPLRRNESSGNPLRHRRKRRSKSSADVVPFGTCARTVETRCHTPGCGSISKQFRIPEPFQVLPPVPGRCGPGPRSLHPPRRPWWTPVVPSRVRSRRQCPLIGIEVTMYPSRAR